MDAAPICPVCGGASAQVSELFAASTWPALTCPACRTTFLWPLPSVADLAPYYEYSRYGRPTYDPGSERGRSRVRDLEGLLASIEARTAGPGTLVDLGCSTGQMLEAGLHRGWRVTGIELDPDTARFTAERLGVEVVAGSAIQQLDSLGTFDLVVMSHWLEHVPAPGEAFQRAAGHLRTGGLLLLRVPNAASRLARFARTGWSWFSPGIHLIYFVPESLPALAKRSGLDLIDARTVRGDALSLPVELAIGVVRRILPTPDSTRGGPGPAGGERGLVSSPLWRVANRALPPSSERFRRSNGGPELLALFERRS